MDTTIETPTIIKGGLSVDDRGSLRFVNDFKFDRIVRFYLVENHSAGFVRAWHGHRHEQKYVYVVSGAALIVAVRLEDARKDLPPERCFRTVLSDSSPSIVRIPGGYYNGFKTLTPGCRVMFFSDASLEQSMSDDLRLPYEAVNESIWEIPYR